jgi:hypothetical protein
MVAEVSPKLSPVLIECLGIMDFQQQKNSAFEKLLYGVQREL